MELKEIKPTAEVEFETAEGVLKFTVRHLPPDQVVLDYQSGSRLSVRVRGALADAIVGWNLSHDDGTPWPCDDKTKALLLPQIVGLPVKQKLDAGGKELVPEGMLLGLALFEFIGDAGNFLKN
jgi:hypothetical protein